MGPHPKLPARRFILQMYVFVWSGSSVWKLHPHQRKRVLPESAMRARSRAAITYRRSDRPDCCGSGGGLG